ncbi:NAD(P)H-dependent oxidoreductase [Agreia sp.]|uniref:NAD(P)H-dependent oxidoreductase n=1 Tax=Agreia sp. TaxID=1872416 RepID=UPI0035BC498E
MTTLVIDGHPNPDSLCAAIAARYAEANGHATVLALRDLDFDPNMRHGYTRRQTLEPDLERAWQRLLDADHVVVVTPVWWGSVPALLKGFFDRLLLPRRAYRTKPSGVPEGLLAGRTGRVIVTTDSPWWYLPLVGDTTVRHVRQTTLRFCGIRPVRATRLGPVKGSSDELRAKWLAKVERLGRADAERYSGAGRVRSAAV